MSSISGAAVPLLLFALAFGAVLAFALRQPLLRTLAVREAVRRRGQTALVIGGLMVGTATITAALVAGDSVGDSTVDAFAYRNWGAIDITVTAPGNAFFDPSVADAVRGPGITPHIDGISPGIELLGSASDLTSKQGTARVTIVGFDPALQRPFGAFTLARGAQTYGQDLGDSGVLLSRTLARNLDAKIGDTIALNLSQTIAAKRSARRNGAKAGQTLTVAGIAKTEGPGAYTLGAVAFLRASTLQERFGTSQINVVRISARGGIRDADAEAARVLPAVRTAVLSAPGGAGLEVRDAKIREAEQARKSTNFIRAMLLGMTTIVVTAGAALVVNITGMLAEERRTRLGVLRALGLRRGKVAGLSIIEGAIYAIVASLAGVIVGVAAGRVVAARFGKAFAGFAGENVDFQFFFSLKPATVLTGFSVGGVLTLLVIAIASRRTSRMTITAAIRNLPEPPAEQSPRRWVRPLRIGIPAVLGFALLTDGKPLTRLVSGMLLIIAAAALARPRVTARVHASVTGLALAGLSFGMIYGQQPERDAGSFFSLFVVALLTAVFGLTIAMTANLHAVDSLVGLIGRSSGRLRAVLRPPLAYLSRRPVRTGLTTGVFSLIVAMLTLFAVFLVVFKPSYTEFGNGYDVRVLSVGSPTISLPPNLPGTVERTLQMRTLGYIGPFKTRRGFVNAERIFVPLFELRGDAASNPPIKLVERSKKYASDAAIWKAVLTDPHLAVTSFSAPERDVTMRAGAATDVTLHIIGQYRGGLLDGVFASAKGLKPFAGSPAGSSMLVTLKDRSKARDAARAIERGLFTSGVDAESVADLYGVAGRANRAFFSTIDILMRMGLIVGILSLGIVALRVVTERRHVIGVLRAIGYRRRQVMGGLMAEAAATSTIGVVVGATVGLVMGWIFNHLQQHARPFGIDWGSFLGVLGVVYAATVIVSIGPAYRASRLPPAEAVRYSE